MTEILRFLFGSLTDPLGLPLDWWKEWAILLVIGEIAYHLAYGSAVSYTHLTLPTKPEV